VFGKLSKYSSVFIARFESRHFVFDAIVAACEEYIAWHEKHSGKIHQTIKLATSLASSLRAKGNLARKDSGGTVTVSKAAITAASNGPFRDLARVRHSIRQWSKEPVSDADVTDAINIAAEGTPSVCNRQTIGTIVIKDKKLMEKVLKIQGGARGIALPQVVIGVVSNLERFREPRERNQAYVDGGLFGMSLMYAFQSKSIATCPLNFAAAKENDLRMRKLLDVPESTVFVMFLAVSHFREEVVYTVSPRRASQDLHEIVWDWYQ
jgi:nitroreductase